MSWLPCVDGRGSLEGWKDASGFHRRGGKPRCALEDSESERGSVLGRRQRGLDLGRTAEPPKIPPQGSFGMVGAEISRWLISPFASHR